MKLRKIILLIATLTLLFCFVGCGDVSINVSNKENLSSENLGEFKSIGNGLYYDTATRIVYRDGYYTFTPYYAPNGLPYRYNPETNTFEEIEMK